MASKRLQKLADDRAHEVLTAVIRENTKLFGNIDIIDRMIRGVSRHITDPAFKIWHSDGVEFTDKQLEKFNSGVKTVVEVPLFIIGPCDVKSRICSLRVNVRKGKSKEEIDEEFYKMVAGWSMLSRIGFFDKEKNEN